MPSICWRWVSSSRSLRCASSAWLARSMHCARAPQRLGKQKIVEAVGAFELRLRGSRDALEPGAGRPPAVAADRAIGCRAGSPHEALLELGADGVLPRRAASAPGRRPCCTTGRCGCCWGAGRQTGSRVTPLASYPSWPRATSRLRARGAVHTARASRPRPPAPLRQNGSCPRACLIALVPAGGLRWRIARLSCASY